MSGYLNYVGAEEPAPVAVEQPEDDKKAPAKKAAAPKE